MCWTGQDRTGKDRTGQPGQDRTDINECQSHPYCGCQLNPEKCVNTAGSCKCGCAEDIPSNDTECITYSDLQIRLNGSSNNMSGRIEIYHPRLGWGTVCGMIHIGGNGYAHLKNTAANVVCRQLGFSGGTVIRTLDFYGKRSGSPAIFSNVQCSGDESFIWDCSHNGWNNSFPSCIYDKYGPVRVDCY
ncbi:scavenger receptor cysteine-rich type 1 protein M160-like [Dendronephthya gigantea]|uniref:scavenger receptor cysteine-rich type 1 protein M160-like n=1 Tax=Dendronephthya gigantea TaxID=151771 RepID=UPI00106B6603|nr:scavenger receptor cysteine-rich type 1 protein M160-like [Dendronephthya gigantea]